MSGKSRGSLYRNVLGGNYGFLAMLGPLAQEKGDKYGNRIVEVTVAPGVVKKVYLFGANDARSYSTIRGITAGGWYADEINTHDEAFIIEAFNRTLVSKDRRHLWTLNPGDPNHFIYTDYLDPYEQNNTPGFRIFRFLLDDNLALTEDRKQEVKAQYSGFYYKRFILGERCSAEGLIYSEINEENFYDDETRPQGLEYISRRLIGIDFGTNNPTVFLNAYDTGDCIYFDDEYYYNSKDKKHMRKQKDPGEYAEDLKEFIARDTISDGVRVAADPSATPLFAACRNRGIILEKANNDVLEGILASSVLYRKRKIKIHRDRCKMYKQELTGYAWDEKAAKAGTEQPIKSNDHVMDCSRYVVKTYIEQYRYSA
jgi:PBSX family phage terminase large subunit